MIKRSTMSSQVYNIIKSSIIMGDYKPDEKLTELGIAKKLAVSATPVREAFKKLETEGFIESAAYKGVRVKSYTSEDIKIAYHIRANLQCLALKEVMEDIDDKKIKELEEILNEAILSEEDHIYKRYIKFHNWIIMASGSSVILKTLTSLNAIINIDRLMYNVGKIDLIDDVNTDENYNKLFYLIRDNDFENAKNMLESMILTVMDMNMNIG